MKPTAEQQLQFLQHLQLLFEDGTVPKIVGALGLKLLAETGQGW
jgi:hypothetical protein